jgi:pimeloyl-ACP methyl ester carboxylesterase
VVFIHGLWLLPSSWANWAGFFEQAGYPPLTPDWPGDPATVAEARANPKVFANRTLKQIADHTTEVITTYKRQRSNPGVTEIVKIPNRGHALTIDHGWREVAQTALRLRQAIRLSG